MLIFDSFPSHEEAHRFVQAVGASYGHLAGVYDSQDTSQNVDPFPFELTPPIVLVARANSDDDDWDIARENDIRVMARSFQGRFAGT